MSKKWFTADQHFGHENIIKHCSRPFGSVEEMDDAIIERHNTVVEPNDDVYIVGDFAFRCDEQYAERIAQRLNGRLHLIFGNHDRFSAGFYDRNFQWAKDYHFLKYGRGEQRRHIALFHYAMRVWDRGHYGAWHLYGHSHGTLTEDPNALSVDVGVDTNDFWPYSESAIEEIMTTKNFKPVDHHRRAE